MYIRISGKGLDKSSLVYRCLSSHGMVVLHTGQTEGADPVFYFDTAQYLTDDALIVGDNSGNYRGLFIDLAEAIKEEPHIRIALVNDTVAHRQPAQIGLENELLHLYLYLPEGLIYECGETVPAEIVIRNLGTEPLIIRTYKTSPVELDVKDLNQSLTLNIAGGTTDNLNVFEIPPGESYPQPIQVNTGDFSGNILLIAKTVEFATPDGLTFFQAPPLWVIIK